MKIRINLLAGLAALSAIAVFQPNASASLVTRNLNVTLTAENLDSYDLDLDSNGTTDFHFDSDYVPDPTLAVAFDQITFTFGTSNAVVIDGEINVGFPNASLLAVGNVVGPSSQYSGPNDDGNLYSFDSLDGPSGDFSGKSGYVGLRFQEGASTLYGFAQITVYGPNDPTNPYGLKIGEVGYDTTGLPLTIPAVPEPASLGMLLLSGTLLSKRARRRV